MLTAVGLLPQSLVPIVAAPILAIGGGNYSALFLSGAVVAAVGSGLVRLVRGAR